MLKNTIVLILKKLSPAVYTKLKAYHCLIRAKDSYIHSTGWLNSILKEKPIDNENNLLPWMNYTIISILKERLKPDMNLFEFGSGYSTIFFAKYVNSVTSIEYDRSWFDLVKSQIPSNANLVYKKNDIDGDYCRSIDKMSKSFDVVVIDGRDRVNCVKNSIQYLTPDGIMLLDDSHRSKYDEAILYATKRGFRALHIEGLKPSGSRIDRTTILYRDNNCFNI